MSTTSCTAGWNASSGAASYQLRKGPSSTIYDGPNTHYWYKATCNNESYVVRACNAGGCSAWSGAVWATPPALWGGGEDE